MPVAVFAVDPPGEVEQELVKDALQERAVGPAGDALLDLIDTPGRPGMHRWVDIAERPLVGGQLAIGVHVPLAHQQGELLLGELGVDQREGHTVESQVPRGEPRVLPGVGHGDDIEVVEVAPVRVAAVLPLSRRRRAGGIAVQPFSHIVVVELLAPEQPREGLALHQLRIVRDARVGHRRVERVCLSLTRVEHLGGAGERRAVAAGREAQTDGPRVSRSDRERVVRRGLGAGVVRADRAHGSIDHGVVDAVFDIARTVRHAPQALGVGLVLGKEQLRLTLAGQPVVAERVMRRLHHTHRRPLRHLQSPQRGSAVVTPPRPGVAEPQRREQMQRRRIWPVVGGGDANQNVLGIGFGILDGNVEVAILSEDTSVEQLVFRGTAPAAAILFDQICVGERTLWIFVERLHIRVSGRVVEIVVVLLHVLAMVPLRARQTEKPLLQDRIGLIPEREAEAELALLVADA